MNENTTEAVAGYMLYLHERINQSLTDDLCAIIKSWAAHESQHSAILLSLMDSLQNPQRAPMDTQRLPLAPQAKERLAMFLEKRHQKSSSSGTQQVDDEHQDKVRSVNIL